MGLNPFKDANLEILRETTLQFLNEKFHALFQNIKSRYFIIQKKAKERLTIMLIPHSEKKIINFHIPIYTVVIIISCVLITVVITSIAIINHTSTIKDVSKLKMHDSDSKALIEKYKIEINNLYDTFQKFKPEISNLYALTSDNGADSLWAKGGGSDSILSNTPADSAAPSLEELNIKEIEEELKTTRKILENTKDFLERRKTILENTPSIWPSEGYIITKFGSQSSYYLSDNELCRGIEIAGFPGSAIRATAPGKIMNISWDPSLGLNITIAHKYGFTTRYSHCEKIVAKINQKVDKNDLIAYMGRTGKSSKHVCFYQIGIGTDYIDPVPFLNNVAQ